MRVVAVGVAAGIAALALTVTPALVPADASTRSGGDGPALSMAPAAGESLENVVYKVAEGLSLKLDLHPATEAGTHPLIIFVHGGGWQTGDKNNCLPVKLDVMTRGYHVACINYRLSGQAIHPAQIEDVKSAIAFLREHAFEYQLDPQRFAVWGSSAGGHLAALAGTTSGDPLFTTDPASSAVQAVVDYYGPTDLVPMVQTPGYEAHQEPDSAESHLLGVPVLDDPALADSASPLTYVTPGDPAFFIAHGTRDPEIPPQQSTLLRDALRDAGVPATLTMVAGAGHGGAKFSTPELTDSVLAFLQKNLG